jgi:pimeloyl-ACP methyl ester carboxylesterase
MLTKLQEINRKLIFVCHSLGGLVVKQALVLTPQSSAIKDIQDRTTGIVFLGTPHGGSHLGRRLAWIAFITGSSKDLASILSIDSKPLNKLSDDFKQYYERRLAGANGTGPHPLKIRCFAEMHRTSVAHTPISSMVVPLKSAMTNLEGEVVTPVEKDHHTICRFESSADPVFVMIWRQLSDWMAQPGVQQLPRVNSLTRVENFERGG